MSYLLTGAYNVQKQIQFVEEATFGVTPASPTFVWPGPIQDFSINKETTNIKYRQVGSRDIYQGIKTGEVYSFEFRLNPVNTTLIGYGINLPAGTGTIEKSLTFLYSEKINNVENYILMRGARCDSIDVEITAEGTVDVSMTFLCKEITIPSTTHGITTPTFATPTNPQVWTNLSGGSMPLTINAVQYDTPNFSFSVTNNLQVIKPNGELVPKFIEPTNREVTVSFDTYYKDTVLEADQKALTARAATYKLTGPGDTPANVTATFTDLYLETFTTSLSPTANEVQMVTFEGFAKGVAVA